LVEAIINTKEIRYNQTEKRGTMLPSLAFRGRARIRARVRVRVKIRFKVTQIEPGYRTHPRY